jgi:hypothetical protein
MLHFGLRTGFSVLISEKRKGAKMRMKVAKHD